MAERAPSLMDLAKKGDLRSLEDRFLEAASNRGETEELLATLGILVKQGRNEQASALAWAWLESRKESGDPQEALALARELIALCGDNESLRQELLSLYRSVYADRPELEQLIKISGLAGGRSPRRAVRTLNLALNLREGDYLVHRGEDHAVQVTRIDPDRLSYTIRNARTEETLNADELALNYDLVEPTDFRVLCQLRQDALKQLLETDPVALIIGILHGRPDKRIDSDHLESMLVPELVPESRWKEWWSRTKTALKRCPNVVVEGRNPIVLTYHTAGQTLEDQTLPLWKACGNAVQRLSAVETYLREAMARGSAPQPEMVRRMRQDLMQRIEVSRRGSPAHALAEALVLERLLATTAPAELPHSPARQILRESPDVAGLIAGLKDHRFCEPALDLLREVFPENWPELYLRILPSAPTEVCEAMAQALAKAGRLPDLQEVVRSVLADFSGRLGAVCWLWRGPGIAQLEPIPRVELLTRLLDHLAQLSRADRPDPEVLREARARIRAAFSANDYAQYRGVIQNMDASLASTIYRTVDRAEGLGQVVQANMLNIIRTVHPRLFVRERSDPWVDENVILCTQAGMARREAELKHLLNVKIPENARAIGEAAARGDLSENSEYKFALEERDLLQARVRKINQEMSIARLLTANDVTTGEVNIGTRVRLVSLDGRHHQELTILGPWEADSEKRIYNYRAPLCMKLKGLRVGDVVNLELEGVNADYRIEAIENALESPP